MEREISNLSQSSKTIDVLFYGFRNMLRQLICHNIKIPCRNKTVALKPKSYVATLDICVATFKLLVTEHNCRNKYFYVTTQKELLEPK